MNDDWGIKAWNIIYFTIYFIPLFPYRFAHALFFFRQTFLFLNLRVSFTYVQFLALFFFLFACFSVIIANAIYSEDDRL